jgi:hypothetical protein
MFEPPSLYDFIDSTSYQSRARTYQENILSKQCLYFINRQIYLECRTGMVSEVGELEPPRMKNPIHSLLQTLSERHEERGHFVAQENELMGTVSLPWIHISKCIDTWRPNIQDEN